MKGGRLQPVPLQLQLRHSAGHWHLLHAGRAIRKLENGQPYPR
jgi:hypothetical protein